eukprot:scaffold319085_cov47-Attheya_sp.AAC.1
MGKHISLQNVIILEPPAGGGGEEWLQCTVALHVTHMLLDATVFHRNLTLLHRSYQINMTEDDRVTDLKLTFARKRQMGGGEGGSCV